jgi:shikimate kinase
MLNDNIYLLLGTPCSGKTTIGNKIAERYHMHYYSGDAKRRELFQLSNAREHPFMSKSTANFYDWDIHEIIEWERGVISEQTPLIISELNHLSNNHAFVLFDGILDINLVSKIANKNRVVYLSANRDIIEHDFFNRDDHKPLFNYILNTPNISEAEKERRLNLRKEAAIHSFCVNASLYGITQYERDDHISISEMVKKIETHFEFI